MYAEFIQVSSTENQGVFHKFSTGQNEQILSHITQPNMLYDIHKSVKCRSGYFGQGYG